MGGNGQEYEKAAFSASPSRKPQLMEPKFGTIDGRKDHMICRNLSGSHGGRGST
jgi:hypothetical protein